MRPAPNKQLQRTVQRHRGRAASAAFHFALASLSRVHRAAAELRRSAAPLPVTLGAAVDSRYASSQRGVNR
jgi:hypothetical protein